MIVEDFFGNKIRGIIFNSVNNNLGNFFERFSGESVDLIVTLKRNDWNGEVSTQLQVEDIISS